MRVTSGGIVAVALAGLLLAAGAVEAQVNPRDVPVVTQPQQRFDSGQDIQPIFEGWTRNEDGSFLLHFGYLNRNYREHPSSPIGPENFFSPGAEDRGQPTRFYPRTQRYQFAVHVPEDSGRSSDEGLVWTLTRSGSVQRAVGWLQPEWEIDANTITSNNRTGFGRPKDQVYANQAPAITASASTTTARVGEPVALSASITDDDLPTELPPRRPRSRLPALTPPEGTPKAPDNIRWYRKPSPPRNGLGVLWVVYRGPADVQLEPSGYQRSVSEVQQDEEVDGVVTETAQSGPEATHTAGDGWNSATFEASVTFDEPGAYTLRAWASDGMLIVADDVAITVE